MTSIESNPVHGTAIAAHGRGFLILGPSGSGKSGLALQMMALGAQLIADDQVLLEPSGGKVIMRAPERLSGQIEARFLGILRTGCVENISLCHVVDLSTPASARMPKILTIDVLGHKIDLINGQNVANLAAALLLLAQAGRTE